jgi:hypothetical protein
MHRRARSTHHPRRAAAVTAVLVALVVAACGGDTNNAGPPALEPTGETDATPMIDPTTGEPVTVPDDFEFTFTDDEMPPSDPDTAATGPDDGAGDADAGDADGGNGGTDGEIADADPPAASPLASVVIETVVIDEDAPSPLDEAGALACANTEFALDAAIEGDPALDDLLTTAGEWAASSSATAVAGHADDLAAVREPSAVEALIVAVLESCATLGYEL